MFIIIDHYFKQVQFRIHRYIFLSQFRLVPEMAFSLLASFSSSLLKQPVQKFSDMFLLQPNYCKGNFFGTNPILLISRKTLWYTRICIKYENRIQGVYNGFIHLPIGMTTHCMFSMLTFCMLIIQKSKCWSCKIILLYTV